jgi:hypothetical protein
VSPDLGSRRDTHACGRLQSTSFAAVRPEAAHRADTAGPAQAHRETLKSRRRGRQEPTPTPRPPVHRVRRLVVPEPQLPPRSTCAIPAHIRAPRALTSNERPPAPSAALLGFRGVQEGRDQADVIARKRPESIRATYRATRFRRHNGHQVGKRPLSGPPPSAQPVGELAVPHELGKRERGGSFLQ